MKYKTVLRLWEAFGSDSFGSFCYLLADENLLTMKQYDKYTRKYYSKKDK